MTKVNVLTAGIIAATLVTPAVAQEAIQEPGLMAKNYPNSDYLTGGYGARLTPGPWYYYRYRHFGLSEPAPFESFGPYAYYYQSRYRY